MTLIFIISFHFDFNERGWKIKEKLIFSLYFARFALSLQRNHDESDSYYV